MATAGGRWTLALAEGRTMKIYLAVTLVGALLLACGPVDSPPEASTGHIEKKGGSFTSGNLTITARPDGLIGDVHVTVREVDLPGELSDWMKPVGRPFDIEVSHPIRLREPLEIKVSYADPGFTFEEEENLFVLHFNPDRGYEPVTVLEHDTQENFIVFESMTFSPFTVARRDLEAPFPKSGTTGFEIDRHAWSFGNFASPFSIGGNCAGMTNYALWHFVNTGKSALRGKYEKHIARLLAMQLQMETGYTPDEMNDAFREQQKLSPRQMAHLLVNYLSLENAQPLKFTMSKRADCPTMELFVGHTMLVYGWESRGERIEFIGYDSNFPSDSKSIDFNGEVFRGDFHYQDLDTNTYKALSSLPQAPISRTHSEAESGFRSSEVLILDRPAAGRSVCIDSFTLSGHLEGLFNPQMQILLFAKEALESPGFRGVRASAGYPLGTTEFEEEVMDVENSFHADLILMASIVSQEPDCEKGDHGSGGFDPNRINAAALIRTVEGHECCQGTEIILAEGHQNGNTEGLPSRIHSYSRTPGRDYEGPEMIWELDIQEKGSLDVAFTEMEEGADLDLFILVDGCSGYHAYQGGMDALSLSVVPDHKYFLVVDSYTGKAGSFRIEFE